jgi:hypothetical protein
MSLGNGLRRLLSLRRNGVVGTRHSVWPKSDRVVDRQRLFAQITSENRYEEISTGPEIGKEKVDW